MVWVLSIVGEFVGLFLIIPAWRPNVELMERQSDRDGPEVWRMTAAIERVVR